MSVSLGLRHTTQKKVTDSVHSTRKKKQVQTTGRQLTIKHQAASHALTAVTTDWLLFVCGKHSWKAVAFPEGISTLQCTARTCWRASSIGQSSKPLTRASNHKHWGVFFDLSGTTEGRISTDYHHLSQLCRAAPGTEAWKSVSRQSVPVPRKTFQH